MNQPLSQQKCRPCAGDTPPLAATVVQQHLADLPGWALTSDGKRIVKNYTLKSFRDAVRFVNDIMEVAEAEDHHPDLFIHSYKKLQITLSTHAIGGLSENDLILAAKINELRH